MFRMRTCMRELVVPMIADGPMLTVAPGAPAWEPPAFSEARPITFPEARPVTGFGAPDQPEEAPAGRPLIGGWIWRTASSLAITAFVLGYWWISYSRQHQLEHPSAKRVPDILAEADRQQFRPAVPDVEFTGYPRLRSLSTSRRNVRAVTSRRSASSAPDQYRCA